MEHPPKQGLKQINPITNSVTKSSFNGTSTKTRIETTSVTSHNNTNLRFNGTSTKTRIETSASDTILAILTRVLMEHPPKQGLKQ